VTVIGDVNNKICKKIYDMVDTAGTIYKAAIEIKEKGASEVYAFITHGII
jgi:ribose-phosphate pyrophosphokinase